MASPDHKEIKLTRTRKSRRPNIDTAISHCKYGCLLQRVITNSQIYTKTKTKNVQLRDSHCIRTHFGIVALLVTGHILKFLKLSWGGLLGICKHEPLNALTSFDTFPLQLQSFFEQLLQLHMQLCNITLIAGSNVSAMFRTSCRNHMTKHVRE